MINVNVIYIYIFILAIGIYNINPLVGICIGCECAYISDIIYQFTVGLNCLTDPFYQFSVVAVSSQRQFISFLWLQLPHLQHLSILCGRSCLTDLKNLQKHTTYN